MSMNLQTMERKMGYLSYASFVVLINGSPTIVFKGLHKGCSLPPPRVTLMVEGLSMLYKDAMRRGLVKGGKMCDDMAMSCLLFVDEIVTLFLVYKRVKKYKRNFGYILQGHGNGNQRDEVLDDA